ncbi:MAG: hypothetical protein ABMA26_17590 [Limisphaerales bacterium]
MRNTFYYALVAVLFWALAAPHIHLGIVTALAAGLVIVGLVRDLMRSSDEKKGE